MAQVTTNTQIDTINILQEASSANATDYFLIQRGATSYKIKKSDIILPISQLSDIGDMTVLGNISGGSASPSEITVLDSTDPDSNLDTAIVTEKRIKDYVDNIDIPVTKSFKGTTTNNTISHGENTIPDIFMCHINGVSVTAYSRANGTDGGRLHASVSATSTDIEIVKPGSGYNIPSGTRTFTAIWFT